MSSMLPVTPANGLLEEDEQRFRDDYEERFAALDRSFDDYLPAYMHGHEAAGDERYAGRGWSDAEEDVRSAWEAKHPDSSWQHFKDAVRHAWERIRR